MLSIADLFHSYLRHYADKNLSAITAMLAEDVHLRDWNISVYGKAAVLHETARNFAEADSLEMRVLALYQDTSTVVGEVHIVVNGTIELYVVDVVVFDAQGKVKAIRSYKGRGD
jgi:steroid delta-isomerase